MKDSLDPGGYTLPPTLDAQLAALWSEDHFAVDGSDLGFLNMCIAAARPALILEIGTATGLSTAALAVMQGHHGIAGTVRSYDLRDVLWFDETRAVGDLVPEVAGAEAGRVQLTSGVTALAVAQDVARDAAGMAFIDASHQHPWPLLDTLLLLPLLAPRAPVVHHDLQLYRNADNPVGVGPKLLFDQLAPAQRAVASDLGLGVADVRTPSRSAADNVFLMWRREALGRQGRELSRGLLLPWTLTDPLEPALVAQIAERLRAHYPGEVARNFEIGHARFCDAQARAAARVAPPLRGLRARLGRA
ncbi:class I SAM-dependent methyltransferase [uncultured Tateyamaria sp.]|uniref:class I SAM-dependent methyltransferase n=1 Tax=Tateyamaria sp. 1078 TaxID=3417464 RepID=UPI00262A4B92|nr:class I SAM-dependent methyltransferase [uncultured Tateyamaria sp.]